MNKFEFAVVPASTTEQIFQNNFREPYMLKNITVAATAVMLAATALAADPPASNAVAEAPAASSAPVVPEAGAPVSSAGSARIRLFGRNGMLVDFFENSACFGGGAKTVVSGGVGAAFSSFFGKASNVSLGIKDTQNTLAMTKKDTMFSKGYFREYKVAVGQPLTLRMGFSIPGAVSCGPVGATLIPEAGKDYEAILDVNYRTGVCKIVLKQLQEVGAEVVLADVHHADVSKCP